MTFNIIGDIAGNFHTLQALLKKMPEGQVIALGDVMDRGPNSDKVIEWLMKNGIALRGNHEDMMIDFIRKTHHYQDGLWDVNGGIATRHAYGNKEEESEQFTIPDEHLAWLESLPKVIEKDGIIITHAPINPVYGVKRLLTLPYNHDYSLGWNRGGIHRMDNKFQVYGHQGNQNVNWHYDQEGAYGVCIDTCNAGRYEGKRGLLTGITWPDKLIFQQEIID